MAVGLHDAAPPPRRSAGRRGRSPRRSESSSDRRNSSVQGMIFAAMMSDTVSPAASIDVYDASIVFRACGCGTQLQQHAGDDAERPLAADEQVAQVVPRHVLHALVAEPHDLAAGEHRLQAQHVVAGHAVLQPAQAAGVLGDVAADGRNLPRPRIGRIEQPVLAGRLVDRLRDDAGLDLDREIPRVDLQNAIHPREAQHDAPGHRHAAAAQAGARAARDDRRADARRAAFTHAATSAVVFGKTTHAGFCRSTGVPS